MLFSAMKTESKKNQAKGKAMNNQNNYDGRHMDQNAVIARG
jgi:hypothetical protein